MSIDCPRDFCDNMACGSRMLNPITSFFKQCILLAPQFSFLTKKPIWESQVPTTCVLLVWIFMSPSSSRRVQLDQLPVISGKKEVTYLCLQCCTTHFQSPQKTRQLLQEGPGLCEEEQPQPALVSSWRKGEWSKDDLAFTILLPSCLHSCKFDNLYKLCWAKTTKYLPFNPACRPAWCTKWADSSWRLSLESKKGHFSFCFTSSPALFPSSLDVLELGWLSPVLLTWKFSYSTQLFWNWEKSKTSSFYL